MRLSQLAATLIAVLVGIPTVALAYPPSAPPPSRPLPSAGASAFGASQRASSLRARGWLAGTRGGLRRPDGTSQGGAGLLHLGLPSGPNASTLHSDRSGVDQYNVRDGERVLRFRFARPTFTVRAPVQLTVGRRNVPVRAVMFDIDGTLVDTRQTIADGIRAGLSALNLPADEAFVADQTRGRAFVDVAADAVHRFSPALAAREPGGQLTPERATALQQQFLSHAAEATESAERNGRASAYPGAARMLSALRARGVGVIAVTSRPTGSAQALLQRYGLGNHFDVVVGRQQAMNNQGPQVIVRGAVRPGMAMAGKPAPSSVLYGLRLFGGVHPSEAVFVGDMHTDIRAAAGAGIATVGIGHGMDTPDMLRSESPTAFVNDISGLQGVLGLGATP